MTPPRTNVYVAPRPMRNLPVAAPCRYCAVGAYLADDAGPLHPCCEMWAAELAAGRPCPACASRRTR